MSLHAGARMNINDLALHFYIHRTTFNKYPIDAGKKRLAKDRLKSGRPKKTKS